MEFTEENLNRINLYLENEEFINIIKKLGIYNETDSKEQSIEQIKEYIFKDLKGQFYKEATDNFLNCIDMYIKSEKFTRIYDEGKSFDTFIDYNLLLPIKYNKEGKHSGYKIRSTILAPNGKEYITKLAEGVKGEISGMQNKRDGLYNGTVAHSVFKYLGEEAAEYIPAFEKFPYYYVVSKNFLKENQTMIQLEDIAAELEYNENGDISHCKIIELIEEFIKDKYLGKLTQNEIQEICNKVKLQYATQETIKRLIKSVDQNLGNTALIITENSSEIPDINISPAYDLDISFLLGEELAGPNDNRNILYRTSREGKRDFLSIMKEFKEEIPGYEKKMNIITSQFDQDYINQIFDIAYNLSEVKYFTKEEAKQKYGAFLMRQVAQFKENYKRISEKQEIQKLQE